MEWGSKHLRNGSVFVSARDVLQDVSNPIRLLSVEVCDQPGDLDEGPATGIGEALVFSSS